MGNGLYEARAIKTGIEKKRKKKEEEAV